MEKKSVEMQNEKKKRDEKIKAVLRGYKKSKLNKSK